jgi:3-methyladenine DNA glycosylase AlkD
MTVDEAMEALRAVGSEGTRRVFLNHGAPTSLLGVKVADMKALLKRTGKDHDLALHLYATGVPDAQYWAGLMVTPKRMTPALLEVWARTATWSMVAEYTVPWVAAEAGHGWTCGVAWIDDPDELVASAGWSALSSHVAMVADDRLDLAALGQLLVRVGGTIHDAQNRVRYAMNGFVIAVGGYVEPLRAAALSTASLVGTVHVDQGGTACKVPSAGDGIAKMAVRPTRKRASVRC